MTEKYSPFFSIVIPTKNRKDYLVRAIRSVEKQIFKDFEIVVVDDGSNYSVEDLLCSLRLKNIRVYRNSHSLGVSGSRNVGINKSSGKWVIFLDDDDEYLPETLSRRHELLRCAKKNIGFSWCSISEVYEVFLDDKTKRRDQIFKAKYRDRDHLFSIAISIGAGFGLAIRRECFGRIGLFDETLNVAEDTDILVRLLSSGYYPSIEPNVGVLCHNHTGPSLSKDRSEYAKTNIYQKLAYRHISFFQKYAFTMSNFCMWGAFKYYEANMFKEGDVLVKLVMKFHWKKLSVLWMYLCVRNNRRYFLKLKG